MTRMPILLLALGLLISPYSAAQQSPTLLNFVWTVHACKATPNNADCTDSRKLLRNTRLGVLRNTNNELWLHVELQNPRMNIEIPVDDVDENKTEVPPFATFDFEDFTEAGKIANKRLLVEWVRKEGQDIGGSCASKLESRLGKDFEQNGKYANQCDKNNLLYWRICTLSNSSNECLDKSMIGTPGDGHGTGSDEPPN